MSYDVYVEWMGGSADFNYTSNMSTFFAWALDTNDTQPWGLRWIGGELPAPEDPSRGYGPGRPAHVVAPYLKTALERIEAADRAFLDTFNAANGWGHWERATAFLAAIRNACLEHPEGRVRVSA